MDKIRNNIDVILLFGCSLFYMVFCNYLMVELPFLTWFDQMGLVENYYNGTLSLGKLMTTYGEHGMFGYNMLFLANIAIFKMTTFFDVYLNDINVTIIGIICWLLIKNTFNNHKNKIYYITIFIVFLVAFNGMQLSSGAMETQVRLGILFFVLASIFVDRFLVEKFIRRDLLITVFLIILSINVFGTVYSFAGIPIIFIITLVKLYKYKENLTYIKNGIIILFTYFLSVLLYVIQYKLIGKGEMNSGGITSGILGILLDPLNTIKSIFAYNASGLLGWATYADNLIPKDVYLIIGFIVTIIYFYSIYSFIYKKMYKKTYMPILFMGYSFVVLMLTMIGRYYEWGWYVNCWYTVHTKLGLIGSVWILGYDLNTKNFTKKIQPIVISSCLGILLIGIFFGNFNELKRVKHERQYYLEKQKYLFVEEINELPVDLNGNTPLLHTPEMTMKSIEILRKYDLSIYKQHYVYEDYLKYKKEYLKKFIAGYTPLYGYDKDGWVRKTSEFKVRTGLEGKITINGRYPKDSSGGLKTNYYVDGKLVKTYQITQNDFIVTFDVPPSKEIKLRIENEFDFKADAPDVRRLSFILNKIEIK